MANGYPLPFALALLAACAAPSPRPIDPAATAKEFRELRLDPAALGLPSDTSTWSLEDWRKAALVLNPDIRAARAELGVARSATQTAGQRANPELGLSFERVISGGAAPWLYGAALDFLLQRPGERERARQIAALGELLARVDLDRTIAAVETSLRSALLDMQFAREESVWLQRDVEVHEALLASARLRAESGDLGAMELVQIQTRLADARTRSGAAEAQEADARLRLAAAVGVPSEALALHVVPAQPSDDAAEYVGDDARLQALVRHTSVQGALHEYALADLELQTAAARLWPGLSLAPGYEWDRGDRKLLLGATLELPLFHRNEGPIAEAAARREAAVQHLIAAQAQVYSEIERAQAALQAALGAAANAHRARDAAQQMREAQAQRVEAGASDQPSLHAAELGLIEAELLHLRTLHQLRVANGALRDALRTLPAQTQDTTQATTEIAP